MLLRVAFDHPNVFKQTILGFFIVLTAFLLMGMGFNIDFLVARLTLLMPSMADSFQQIQRDYGHILNFIFCLIIASLLGLNWFIIRKFSRKKQIIIIWIQLFVLVLLFFYTFNLSFEFILQKLPFLISEGMVRTLYISAISIFFATIIALIGAMAKLSSNGVIYGLASFYTSLFRGLPLLMQVYLIYQGLPQLGYVVDAVPAGILALSLCYGAYMTEIFRAGIQSIDRGQFEGATALGLKRPQTMFLIILPQAMRVIIPPTGSQFIAMLKDSSLVSVIGVWELTYLSKTLGQKDFKHMEMLITASLIYWFLSIILELIQARLERHYAASSKR